MWQDFLFRHHIQACPSCQRDLATVDETKPLLIQEEEMDVPEDLWLAIKAGLKEAEKKVRFLLHPGWKWATAAAGILVIIGLGLWVLFGGFPGKRPVGEHLVERFQIKYIRVEDKPAKTYLYTLNEPKIVFIWAEKNS